ncbi:MAG: AAA family ATPase [Chitinophagaceae bacterium]|nr:AAA family ATPase [Chitinophagaceae bacterium]MBL0306365.1 AAA family ATPase [Chitinophagaceae bacterium]HQV60847.1 AAA family ATPase [Chitinophagaceae bacterium]HQV87015.1 AAA family ATPase [Chitinophagaceae bacterium]HQX73072.1 AAA family ATPase [Chitinophagaceae bacterium]
MLKKIVILGPESTGKSTLCEQLAQHYETMWCPEFAREYLLTNGTNYEYEDLLTIARGQLALEDEYSSTLERNSLPMMEEGGHLPLFIDTDMYVMKVWSEFVFGKCHRFILDQIGERKYDLYLLCNTDLPWVEDELREYPELHTRKKLYSIYKDIMVNQPVPWVDISGDDDARLRKGIAAIDTLLG